MWGVLKWNPAFLRKVFAAAGGPECPKPHLIPFSHINPLLGAFRTDSDGTFTVRFGVAITHGRLQVSHIDPGGQNMTERFSYLAQTVIVLYDGLFVVCQGAFVTPLHNEIIKNQASNIKKILNTGQYQNTNQRAAFNKPPSPNSPTQGRES
jgi:hypothetical protein